MIPANYSFMAKPEYKMLRQRPVQLLLENPENIVHIKFIGVYEKALQGHRTLMYKWRVTIDTVEPNVWQIGMKAKINETVNHNGEHEIVGIGNNYLDIISDVSNPVYAESGIGTVEPFGIASSSFIPAERLLNNNGDLIGYKYTTSGVFLFKFTKEYNDLCIQINNIGQGNISVVLKFSVDGLIFTNFPTNLTATIEGGNAEVFVIAHDFCETFIKIEVTSENVPYYVVAR